MKKKLLIFCLIGALLSGTVLITGHASGLFDFMSPRNNTVTISQEEYQRLSRYANMDTILRYVEDWYYQEPDVDTLIENATQGLLYGLGDPYTFYYNEQEWAKMWEDDEGEYAGVGMQLLGSSKDYTVTVTRVFKDTPAERAGIRRGDKLVRVEDIEVTAYTLNDAVDVMRGTVGEAVEIELLRGNEYLTFQVVREMIHVNRIEYTMLEAQVGYIALYEFAGQSEKEFAVAYEALKQQGAKALVLDLRDNGGGWVQQAVDIADLFLDETILVYDEDRYGNRDEYKTQAGKDDIPLVILINENTASTSEILAGGLQDLGRATLVGVQSFGKGVIQQVIPLNDNKDGFQMTVAQYFLPSGNQVHDIGITPDIVSEMPEELANELLSLADMRDTQLKDAWEAAKQMIP